MGDFSVLFFVILDTKILFVFLFFLFIYNALGSNSILFVISLIISCLLEFEILKNECESSLIIWFLKLLLLLFLFLFNSSLYIFFLINSSL